MWVALSALGVGVLLGSARAPWPARLIAPAIPLIWWAVEAMSADEPTFTGESPQYGLMAVVALVSAVAGLFGIVAGLLLRDLIEPERNHQD